jgi:hypothetical protein
MQEGITVCAARGLRPGIRPASVRTGVQEVGTRAAYLHGVDPFTLKLLHLEYNLAFTVGHGCPARLLAQPSPFR